MKGNLGDYNTQILSVDCPWCKAKPTMRCKSPNGSRAIGPHLSRRERAKLVEESNSSELHL